MIEFGFLPAALTIALRDLGSSPRRFVMAFLVIAAGVGVMSGVRGLSAEAGAKLRNEVRQWIAADAAVEIREQPSEEQWDGMKRLRRRGVEYTAATEAFGMVSSSHVPDRVLASVKAVDPALYPFYGAMELRPAMRISAALSAHGAVVSQSLLDLLGATVGQDVLINHADFRIAAVLVTEPDRFAAAPNAYPRVILSTESFARTGIARLGNDISWRLLFRLPAEASLQDLTSELNALFPDGHIVDYRDPDPRAVASLEAVITFVSLLAWMALVLGSLSAGTVMYIHIQERLDTVAVMKSLGGRSAQIIWIHLLQVGLLAFAGSSAGVLLGVPLGRVFLALIGSASPVRLEPHFRANLAFEALSFGFLSALLVAAVPLLGIRSMPPSLILRRHMQEGHRAPVDKRLWSIPIVGLTLLALGLIQSWRVGAYFVAGLAAAALTLRSVCWLVLEMVRKSAEAIRATPLMFRLAARNVARPGRHAASILAVLAGGVMMVSASWLGQISVARVVSDSLPLPGADMFAIGIGSAQAAGFARFLNDQAGVEKPVRLIPLTILKLLTVDGADKRLVQRKWVATCTDNPEVAISDINARALEARIGSRLEFSGGGRKILARVSEIATMDSIQNQHLGLRFNCAAFAGLNVSYEAGVTIKPAFVADVRRLIAARYPSVAVITRSELVATLENLAGNTISLLRALSWLILLCGAALLALIVAATERLRTRETAILKALGARPRTVMMVSMAEFGIIGIVAGALGSILGSGFASLLLSEILRKPVFAFDWRLAPELAAMTAALAIVSGWLASLRMLRRRPLEVLRGD